MAGDSITTRQAAAELGVAQRSVVRYILLGRLPARRVWEPDGPYLVKRADVEALKPKVAKARERRHRGLVKPSS